VHLPVPPLRIQTRSGPDLVVALPPRTRARLARRSLLLRNFYDFREAANLSGTPARNFLGNLPNLSCDLIVVFNNHRDTARIALAGERSEHSVARGTRIIAPMVSVLAVGRGRYTRQAAAGAGG
jgi:hypothetical protein